MVYTWKLNGCPALPVALVLLAITGPEGGAGCTVMVSVAVVVPPLPVALRFVWKVPVTVGVPVMAERPALNVKPGGRLVTAREVAKRVSNW